MAIQFAIHFPHTAWEHLESYKKSQSKTILEAIKTQLRHRPFKQDRTSVPLQEVEQRLK